MTTQVEKSPLLGYLIGMAAFVVVVAGMKAAAGLLVPIALALFLAVVLNPVVLWLRRRGWPASTAVLCVALLAVLTLGAFATLASVALADLRHTLPRFLARVDELEKWLLGVVIWAGVPTTEVLDISNIELFNPAWALGMVGGAMRGMAGAVTLVFAVLLITIFALFDIAAWPAKVRRAAGRADLDLSRFERATTDIQRYLLIKTLISLATGLGIGGWVWIMGLESPVLWGLLGFVLNYIPTVGSIVAAIPAVLVALLDHGLGTSLGVAGGYLFVNFLLGNIMEPAILGRGAGLSAFSVVLSLFFWGWVWGPVGMLLSFPLTLGMRAVLDAFPGSRWVAVLLGPAVRPEEARSAEEEQA